MEQLYIINENGTVVGLTDRNIVHQKGLLHLAVQCWVMNEMGEVLIQRRSTTKDKSAGKWDVSFGGHCSTVSNTADIFTANVIKEGQEELGLTLTTNDITKLGEVRYTSQNNNNRELLGIFLINKPKNTSFTFTDGEVCDVKWIHINDLEQYILHNPQEYANRIGALSLLKIYLNNR
ncbi:MAG: NUDIX domain-containing protein [Alphaproteobacteria bacterium]|nr:NUDIX domain-containing protein [Alphaproteobacteria bacterium]